MPNTRSAEKRLRQTRVRTLRNRIYKSRVKTFIRRFEEALAEGDRERAAELLRKASSVIDKAAKKGVIHANAAARRKSRLYRLFNGSAA
ncbi:MAG: 30S ribosomal protein S20 [Thermaerobacter sp.]|nr:30S ribosomal protein S20 [Bacillota bacterium]REJ38303.1 MAG: 30S ribosomal protein S20 [Bacillota bacterium]